MSRQTLAAPFQGNWVLIRDRKRKGWTNGVIINAMVSLPTCLFRTSVPLVSDMSVGINNEGVSIWGRGLKYMKFHPTIYPRLIWVAKLRNEKRYKQCFLRNEMVPEIYLGIKKRQ